MRYYVDTCVWRDHFEQRKGPNGRPLGKYATDFFARVVKEKNTIILSDHLFYELKHTQEIDFLLHILDAASCLEKVTASEKQKAEAENISEQRKVGLGDCLHAVLARDAKAVLITQNIRDFEQFLDFLVVELP